MPAPSSPRPRTVHDAHPVRHPLPCIYIRIPSGKRLAPAPAFFWWWMPMSKIVWRPQKWCCPSGSAPSLLFHQDCLLSPERHARGWQNRNHSRVRLSEMRWAHSIIAQNFVRCAAAAQHPPFATPSPDAPYSPFVLPPPPPSLSLFLPPPPPSSSPPSLPRPRPSSRVCVCVCGVCVMHCDACM
jgi:hypothetical protein